MRLIALASLAALAACNSADTPEEQPAETNNLAIESPVANVVEAPADEPAGNEAEPANETAEAANAAVIPTALQGRWGLVPADCTSTRGDNKGLVTITADRLRFYESRATIAKINEADDSRIDADFDFEGEGQTWKLRMTLDAQDGNKVLIRRDYGADAQPGPLRYEKCAA
jgi:hypothetical protein